jgi:diacylglycerol kinase (ATP)
MDKLGVVAHDQKQLGGGLDEFRRLLSDALGPDDRVRWKTVSRSKDAPKQVRKLLDKGIDRLLVWGGDGTVRRCIHTIVEEDATVEVGILPAGTANLLANGLGIPIDLESALDVAVRGRPLPIDIGRMNGESFAVMAGTGFDALLIRDADDGKERFGRAAYVTAGLRHLDTDGADVTIDVDGRRWYDGPAACVLFGNVGKILGGIEVFPDARMDDGCLDLGVITAEKRRDWVRVGARALTGNIGSSPFVEVTQGSEFEVRLDHKLPWELDGGDRPKTKRFTVTVLPQRISICVPVPPPAS